VDALLIVKVVPVSAAFGGGWARWDGASQQIRPNGFWSALTLNREAGNIGALSLVVGRRGMDDRLLYANAGGIQVMTTLSLGGRFVHEPPSQWLKDPERNAAAVRLTLGPLIGDFTPTNGGASPRGRRPPAGLAIGRPLIPSTRAVSRSGPVQH
jgi:hypothetical protein